ncbi:hypothetical protein AB0C96_39510 [Streptomyces sp. NPDC048506]|uniref:hypothetical protein n=1 Tax=Streptomyces sp. NPDC048506 TaxID=3155028 RepID=UPI0034463C84
MNVRSPRPTALPEEHLHHPRSRAAFRTAKLLTGGYLGLSALTLVAVALLHNDAALVNDAVWVRATIVVVSALVTFLCAVRAARGSRTAYRRLRIISGIMLVAVVAVIALPGTFPLWLKVEQGVCGLALLGVAAIVNGRHLRALFATA